MAKSPEIHGLLAEFDSPEVLLEAAKRAHADGYRRMDAYTPFPVEGLADAIGFHRSQVPLLVLTGAILGALAGYMMQYWMSAVSYPLNVGGRPLHSWPSFIPITFELAILGAALFAVLGMIALNGLPMPYHPVFNAPNFELASRNRFFLCIEKRDQKYDAQRTRELLVALGAVDVREVAE